jgi:hypothetical protein
VTAGDIQARTGSFLARRPNVTASQEADGEGTGGFLGLILIVLLVI